MHLLKHYLTLFTTAITLAACATITPTYFYTLSNIGQSSGSEHLTTNATHIDLRPVIVPERLKRTQIVLNTANSTELTMLENERWASAFNDELHDAISAELNKQLLNESATADTQKSYRVWVELHRLEIVKGQAIKAELSWKITRLATANSDEISSTSVCQLQLTEPVGNSTNLIVQGLQKVVLKLSIAIAGNITNLNAGKTSFCQLS
jgi:uncharacterized lipoprotein YmbA